MRTATRSAPPRAARSRKRASSPPAVARVAPSTLAVVDMGSNSFRLEVGRVEGDQIYRLDTQRETLRLGAGVDRHGNLTPAAQRAAIDCLARFGERLAGMEPSAVRAVATNVFRVAANGRTFLTQAERALGFPIDVITGHEEARLIYLGVAHVLPPSPRPRLVVDIGGGSTEFIVGERLTPVALESLNIGCVTMSRRFFADGALTDAAFDAAQTAARAEIEVITRDFSRTRWTEAYASSGTALALAEILEQNAYSSGGITREGLARLRRRLVAARHLDRVRIAALKPARAPVLPGGLAIMAAALDELDVARINPVGGALRLGVLYDLLGRTVAHDARDATVEQFLARYRLDAEHARRVAATARLLFFSAQPGAPHADAQMVERAALLHETGFSVSHTSYHKHGAYILRNADMPGFSSQEQERLSWLVLGCRGRLDKMSGALDDERFRAQLCALRLAVLFHHARRAIDLPRMSLAVGKRIRFTLPKRWLADHPLTRHLLAREAKEWSAAGYPWSSQA